MVRFTTLKYTRVPTVPNARVPSNAATESPITSAESPNAAAESPNDAAESSNATAEPSNAVINAVEYPNNPESESFIVVKRMI